MNYDDIDFGPLTRFASDGALTRNKGTPSTKSSDTSQITRTSSGSNNNQNIISGPQQQQQPHGLNCYHLNESGANKRLIEVLNQLSPANDNNNNNITKLLASFRLEKDMRFQQKQQLEREQRRVEMTSSKLAMEEATTTETISTTSSTKAMNSNIAPGKVRQMFDERRRGTGIDKSYPLKPLSNSNNNNQRSTSGSSGNSSSGGGGFITKKTTTTTINSTNRNGNIVTSTSKMSSSSIAATKSLRKQVIPSSQQQQLGNSTNANLKKTSINGRLNAPSINERNISTTRNNNNNNNNNNNSKNDYPDDVDNNYNNNNNHNDNDNNCNNDNDYNDDNNDFVNDNNINNENISAIEGVMNETNNKSQQINNGKSFENENNNNLDDETFPDEMNLDNDSINKKMPNIGKLSIDERNNNSEGDVKPASNLKLKPVITRKTLPQSPASTLKKNSRETSSPNNTTNTRRTQVNTPEKPLRNVPKNNTKTLSSKTEIMKTNEAPKPSFGPPPPGMAACQICGRHFNSDRVEKHEEICLKASNKKRKIFDSTKHRVKGTEAEVYLRRTAKGQIKSDSTKNTITVSTKAIPTKSTSDPSSKKGNWRKKHEEFIAAIRAAKEVQKHLAKGGKLSDLPPPPPSENPDYIQCPHCLRRFNEAAANRHIPKCANMLHNKPKAKPAPKKRY